MSQSTVDGCTTMQADGDVAVPAPPPPPPHRRPRVREVSSRFMSPVVSSSSSCDLHLLPAKSPFPKPPAELQSKQQQLRSNSAQRRRRLDLEVLCSADGNQSLETPLDPPSLCKAPVMSTHGKLRTMKSFKENGGREEHQQPDAPRSKTSDCGRLSGRIAPLRPDTPTVTGSDRSVPLRSRIATQLIGVVPAPTAAAKLLRSSGMSVSAQTPDVGAERSEEATSFPVIISSLGTSTDSGEWSTETLASNPPSNSTSSGLCTTSSQGNVCSSSLIPAHKCKIGGLPELRSSMPEAGMLPTVSNRFLAERNCSRANASGNDASKISASPCSRSLNIPLSNCVKTSDKVASLLSKPFVNPMKTGGLYLPPQPPCNKLALDARKGRKVSSHQEDVHSLRLLHNRYLQWRYANAKAEASMDSQRTDAERTLYSLGLKIADFYDSVRRKRIELSLLQRTKNVFSLLEVQMPYLDEWSTLEDDYTTSLSETIQVLRSASLQLPISGNVRADVREVGDALNSASKVLDIIAFYAQSFMPKAEEMDTLISNLAKFIVRERTLVEECGDLLPKTYTSQMEECSLRGQLIQLQRSSLIQTLE